MIARKLLIATGVIISVVATGCDGSTSSPLTTELSPTPLAASKASSRRGELHVTKECSQYGGKIGDFCTITASNVKEIRKHDRVYYLSALNFNDPSGLITYDGDVRVVTQHGIGFGHCIITDFAHALGECRFSGGTDRFEGFTARAAVTGDENPVVAHWDGWYQFVSDEERAD